MVKILKVVERLMLLDRLLKKGETGNAKQLASKLGVSRSQVFNHFDELKDLGVKVRFNKSKSSYEYFGDYELEVRYPLKVILKDEELKENSGGTFRQSPSLLDCFRLTLS
ncbi:HTH domain-containing protein [Marinifilum sp. D737]|uniref:HTH domain-containing protein n=1 Tax=Marinifilum sp. D737 TaxID=2969628 RepID=UPI0022731462|nr:HTH domain-containing protein [Marinifilum sp. D737]MCY1636526.1 helix-turn-helix domain-containing protein [Marinifilum sp. D737]